MAAIHHASCNHINHSFLCGLGYRAAHENFKIPITIQDLDQTNASKSLINKIKNLIM